MRNLARSLFCVAFLLSAALSAAQQVPSQNNPIPFAMKGPEAKVEPAKTSVEIGEPFELAITVPLDGEFESLTIAVPKDQERQVILGSATKVGPRDFTVTMRLLNSGERQIGPFSLKVVAAGAEPIVDENGEERLPSIEVTGQPVNFQVADPAADISNELRDYTPPKELSFNYFWRNVIFIGATVLVLLLAAAVIAALVVMMAKRSAQRRLIPPVPPIVTALASIRELKTLQVFAESGAERHYTLLSNVVRRYFEGQFVVSALEMSEDEVVDFIEGDLSHLPSASPLVGVLRRSSMAKFAREDLTADVASGDCEVAEQFLLTENDRLERERLRAASQAQQGPAPDRRSSDSTPSEIDKAA